MRGLDSEGQHGQRSVLLRHIKLMLHDEVYIDAFFDLLENYLFSGLARQEARAKATQEDHSW